MLSDSVPRIRLYDRGHKAMKRFAIGFFALTGAIVGVSGIACAAELPLPPPVSAKAPMMAPPPVPFSWTGFYIGGNGGYAWGNSSDTNPAFGTPTTGNFRTSGALAGGQIGYNWQFDAFVVGLESDFDWSNVKGSTSNGICGLTVCTTSDSWIGTTRGRVGFAVDHWLFYGTGGVAYGNIRFNDLPLTSVNGTAANIGWTAGGGIEYAFTRNWSVKAEYLYVSLDNTGFACTPGCGTSTITFNENIARGGVNYRF
jgi:outer membrane immunogenic protein